MLRLHKSQCWWYGRGIRSFSLITTPKGREAMFTTDVLTQLGISPSSLGKFTGIAVIIFLVIKYRVIRIIAVDEATELVRVRFGKVWRRLSGKRKGRIVRLKPGGHLIIRGVHAAWPISRAEMVSKLEKKELALHGYGYIIDTITIGYRILATDDEDDEDGDAAILRYLLSVQNPNREDQISEGVRLRVEAIVMHHVPDAMSDDHALRVSESTLKELVREQLYAHGVELTSFTIMKPSATIAHSILKVVKVLAGTNENAVVSLLKDGAA